MTAQERAGVSGSPVRRGVVAVLLAGALAGACSSAERREHALGRRAIERAALLEDQAERTTALAEAETHLAAACAAGSDSEVALDLARCRLVKGSLDPADEAFAQFVARAQEQVDAYEVVIEAYLLTRHPERARAWHTKAAARHPDARRLRVLLGDIERAQRRADEAVAAYTRALDGATDTERAEVHTKIARAHLERVMGAVARAMEAPDPTGKPPAQRAAELAAADAGLLEVELALRRALYAAPAHVEAHLLLGGLYHQQGRLNEAVLEYEEALAREPNLAGAHYALGVVRHAGDRLALAVESYRAAIRLAPRLREARLGLGTALLELGQTASGLDELASAGLGRGSAGELEAFASRLARKDVVLYALVDALDGADAPGRSLARDLLTVCRKADLGPEAAAWRTWLEHRNDPAPK